MIKRSDRILGASRGTADDVIKKLPPDVKRRDDVVSYLRYLEEYCLKAGLDFSILAAQSDVETNLWRSDWWIKRLNPAGIGITGDRRQDQMSAHFSSLSAAKAHVAHMLLYTTGYINKGGLVPNDDPRYSAYLREFGQRATVERLADLGNGRWATDPKYSYTIEDRARRYWSDDIAPTPKDEEYAKARTVFMLVPAPWDGSKDVVDDETGIAYHADKRMVTVNVGALNVRQGPSTEYPMVHDGFYDGDAVSVLGWCTGESVANENRWWVTEDFGYLWAGGIREEPA